MPGPSARSGALASSWAGHDVHHPGRAARGFVGPGGGGGSWRDDARRTWSRRIVPWMIRTYSGHSTAKASNELYRSNLAKGQTGLSIAFDLPTQTGLRPRPRARPRRGGQGGRAGGAPRPHERAARRHPGRRDEHVDDDQRAGRVAVRPLRRQRREPGRAEQGPPRHHPERHREGVPVARHVHLPAAAVAPADRRHGRVLRGVGAAVEPDERVQLPPAGGRRHARAGAGLLAGHRHRRARRGEGVRARSTTTGSRRCSRRSASS